MFYLSLIFGVFTLRVFGRGVIIIYYRLVQVKASPLNDLLLRVLSFSDVDEACFCDFVVVVGDGDGGSVGGLWKCSC